MLGNGILQCNTAACRTKTVSIMSLVVFFVLVMNGPTFAQSPAFYLLDRRPAEIVYIDREQLSLLAEHKIDITSLRDGVIHVRVDDDEFKWVADNGWDVRSVPDEASLVWAELKARTMGTRDLMGAYHTYDEMVTLLEDYATSYPYLCRLESIGKSVQNRDLWVMKITDNPDVEEPEPEVKLISTMHGNELTGLELTLNLIGYLLDGYETDEAISDLVDETEIWIMPLMNPDGYDGFLSPRRNNANDKDLNRNFPDRVSDPVNTTDGREPETQAVMEFSAAHSFVLSANFHTGALVVNYPYDSTFYYPANPDHPDWYTSDNDVFVALALVYASTNVPMSTSLEFTDGITNGVTWYQISGGMQDWNYVWMGCNEITIELSDDYIPPPQELPQLWEDNRESLLNYIAQAHIGIRGIVTDLMTGEPLSAEISVTGRDYSVFTDPDVGDYYRLLLPGTYDLTFEAEGYEPVTVEDVAVSGAGYSTLDVMLYFLPEISVDRWDLY